MPSAPSFQGTPADRRAAPLVARLGLIVNARSHAHTRGRAGLEAVLRRHPEVERAAPDSQDGLLRALRHFAEKRVGLVAVSGGDGTVRDVLSALPHAYGGDGPAIAILAAGNTNLAARALGSPGRGGAALQRLIVAAEADRLRRRPRPVLEISWAGQAHRPVIRGFLFGAAAFVEGKRLADTRLHRRGIHHGLAVALALAGSTWQAVFARADAEPAGTPMQVGIDDAPFHDGRRFLLLATTLDRLLFGVWPFWGEGDGPVRLFDVDACHQRLPAALLAVARRRPKPWMADAGYRSARARSVRIRLDQPFLLDGEAFDPGPDGILLAAPGSVTVVSP